LLVVNPEYRLTAEQALKHTWFVENQVAANAPPLVGAQHNLIRHFSHRLSKATLAASTAHAQI